MHGFVHVILITTEPKCAVDGIDRRIVDLLDRAFILQPVADQIRDRANYQAMSPGKVLEIRAARHGAVIIQYLNDDSRRCVARQARHVTTRLCVPRPRQHAARL